jgi:hypothetical protein
MAAETLELNDAQRRAIGVRLESMGRLLAGLRLAGFESGRLTALEEALGHLAADTGAMASEAQRNFVQATLAQLWVRAMEIGSRQLRSYGALDERAAASLDQWSERLGELVTELIDEYEERTRADAV